MNKANRKQTGLSLIELMVALVIGSLLLLGAASLLINNKRIYQTQDQLGRMQESARFAIQRMFHDISMAGYFGCMNDAAAINNNLKDNLATAGADYDVSRPVEGFENATGNWQPSDQSFSPTPARTRASGADGITVRSMSGMSYYLDSPIASQTDDVKVEIPRDMELDRAIEKDDYVIIADCRGADIFQATAVTRNTSNRTLTLKHNTGSDNKTNSLHKLYEDYENIDTDLTRRKLVARVARLNVSRYYIAAGSKGGASLSLYRNNEELVEGVTDMQLLYGINNNNDANASPDEYVSAAAGIDWPNVVSVKITLTFEPVDRNFADTADDPEWQYTTTIRIRNNTGTII